MTTRNHSLTMILALGFAVSSAAAQPAAPGGIPPVPNDIGKQLLPPGPAFDKLPEAVQKAAKAYDTRLTTFECEFVAKTGSVMMYRVFGTGPKLEVTMSIAESGRVLTAIIEDSDGVKAPRELIDAIKTRANAGQIISTTRYTEDYNEYRDWLDIPGPKGPVRRASITAVIGILFDEMTPAKLAQAVNGEVLDVRDDDAKALGRKNFESLPEAVRALVASQSDQLTEYIVDQKSVDFYTIRAIGKATDVTVETLGSGTLLHLNREVPAKAGEAPPELATVSAEFYPDHSVKARSYVHDLRIEYRALVRDGGKRYVAVMRSSGQIEFVNDVPKPARPTR